MDTTIQQKIITLMSPVAEGRKVADVRIGMAYTSVRLDNGNTGIAWTAKHSGCCQLSGSQALAGSPATELLNKLSSTDNARDRTIGLATANALAAGMPRPQAVTTEILDLIDVQPSEHVAMVGFFGPLVPRLRRIGCRLDIQELQNDKPGTITPEEGRAALAACDVAIITATSVVTGTIDDLLASLGKVRAAVVLGPSTFMRPEVFAGTPVTHIAGVFVRDAATVEQIISEGGGTKMLKPYMDFATICVAH